MGSKSKLITVLEYRRRELGLTQIDLAKKAKVSQGLISLIESGSMTPAQEVAKKLGKILEVDPDQIQESYEEYLRDRRVRL